jgi:uncharacterized protein
MLTEENLDALTLQYGGEYSLNHTRRILKIASIIGAGMKYRRDIVVLAAYLHDWGAYPPWEIKGVDHAARSTDVAAQFLETHGYGPVDIAHVIECIQYHHVGGEGKSLEAKLLSDADGIDFIGVIGAIRNFSTRPKELRKAFNAAKTRLETVRKNICLDGSRAMVEHRIATMTAILREFEEETFGIF